MKTTPKFAALAAASLLALALAGCSGSATGSDADAADAATESGFPETIRMAVIPAENSTSLEEGYAPIIALLEDETGSEVEVSQASDYAGAIEGLIADKVDVAFLGSFAYVIATQNDAEVTPLGAVVPEKGEEPGYYSLAITQGDNDEINSLEDFADKDVCFVDPGSTSGYLYPTSGLIEAGVIESGLEEDVNAAMTPVFAGAHDASALAIAHGDCDAGFAMQPMVEGTLIDNGELKDGDVKVLWTSPRISGSLMVANNSLGDESISTLQALFAEKANSDYLSENGYCDASDCLLTDEDAWGFAPAEDADYDGTREVCTLTKSDKCA
jgi:phosphonate transport system substrate-binding protein